MDMIQRLLDLRQSATGAVVSEAGFTQLQQKMHVPAAIEKWIDERVVTWRANGAQKPLLIMLSGNAGDGKSDLIERLVGRIGAGKDVSIIRDATHAETPTIDQTGVLAEFFEPFADGTSGEPGLSMIAMNTGMALSFFAKVADGSYGLTYKTLESVVRTELGLSMTTTAPPWEYEIINLDLRSVLPHDYGEAIFPQMLDKLDPSNEAGLLFEAAEQCKSCCVREWCFVHTNVQALQVPQVRTNLISRLWSASLTSGIHLTPRNMWDFLYQVTTGGVEFFNGVNTPCEKIAALSNAGPEAVSDIHRRLIYNLLFEGPNPEAVRGPVLEALAGTDPTRRVGRFSHEVESATYNDPTVDADSLALDLTTSADQDGSEEPDPCLMNLALLLKQSADFDKDFCELIAKGVLRRAALFGAPSSISDELADPDLPDYLALLDAYRGWAPGTAVPEAIYEFKALLEAAIARIFGAFDSGQVYFRQDSFSPSTRYAVFAKVDLGKEVEPEIDRQVVRSPGWLDAVNYRPEQVAVRIGTDNYSSVIRGDFPLYRLFKRVQAGYAASSVDLEAFFGLRFACEQLGGIHNDATELVVQDLQQGGFIRLREKTVMNKQELILTTVRDAL
jgi:hypothetical protein